MSQGTGSVRKASAPTVIEHVLSRLNAVGISEVFGVAGDYAFPVDDGVVRTPGLEWVGCCNELKGGTV
jgi:indolepyruvate decarboxylase